MVSKFVRGLIDGSLSTLGIIIGASAAPHAIIIAAAVGGTVANGISNIISAFSAEGAGQYAELREVEKAMVDRELKNSELDRQIRKETITAGAVDGLGTILGGCLPILPFLFLSPPLSMYIAIGAVIILVAAIGLYLGKLSRRSMVLSAVKMAAFGIGVAAVVYFIQLLIIP